MRIDYHPAVATELEDIRNYYDSRAPGIGNEFVNEFERHVFAIAAMPTRWMTVRGDIRRSLMKRFPYVIFFRIVGDDQIRITVVKHEKRHPSLGLSRH